MVKSGLIPKFAALSAPRLQRLQNLVVRLEQGGDAATDGREAQRELHTIKGEARILGLDRTARLAHAVEELLHAWLAEEPRSHETARRLLLGLDRLGAAVAGIAEGAEPEMDVAAIARELGLPGAEPPRSAGPPSSAQAREPAAAWSPSMFCVTRNLRRPAASHLASTRWASLGSALAVKL